ncbi:HYR-like domain-containing protein, partial [Lacinutrix undariae]
MKNLYTSKTNTYKQLMHFALVAFMACFVSFNSYSQVRVDFEERSSVYTPAKTIYNVKGDFTMIGNTNLTLENYSNTRANGGNDMIYVDVDNDPYTLNSSSATLTLSEENDANPECSNIIYAGLYWSGRSGSANTFNVTKDVLTGNTTSQQVTETDIIYPTENIPNTNYTITKTVSNGTYTFKFTSSGAGDTYNFIYRTSGNNKTLHVKVNGGSETAVSTSSINNNNAYLSTPYSIYSGTDYSFELTRFRLQGTDRAFINITYTEEIPETVQVTKNYDKHQISIKGPGASTYTQLTASNNEIYYPTNTDQYIFSAYTEVTDYVKTNGLGDYVVADMALKEGDPDGTGYFGGWGMVVVYENTLMKWRDITIFDGHAFVKSGDSGYQIDVDGFNAVQSGDVNFKLGVMAGEGDVAYSGDSFQIENKNTATYTSLSHSGNSTSNFFNSSIATGGNTRNPNLVNNSGMDISMFDVNNTNNAIIDNNQTSTSFKYFTNGDTYSIYNVTFSIEAYIPVSEGLLSASSINGNPPTYPLEVVPGDIVEYNVEIRNKGTEPIVDGKLVIPIPFTSNYVYSSLSYNEFHSLFQGNPPYFDPNEGATGAIVWDFSYLPLNSTDIEMILADITFELEATTDCSILINDNCEPKIVILGGYIEGTGEISKVDYQLPLIQGYQEDGNCQGEPNTDPIAVSIDSEQYILDNCTGISVERDFYYCSITGNSIPVSEVEANFPPGSLFYDSYPITSSTIQYTDTTPLPATIGLNTYYAIPPGNSTCNYIFTIEINEIETTPEVANISYCFEETASPLTATVTNSDYSVFFFADNNPSTTGQATLIPNTDTSGVFTYYAAEGPSNTCSGTRTPFTVTVHPEITITLEDITNESCAESNDGTIDISVSGGSGTYTYDWDNNGAENPDTDAQDLSGADNGTHTVIVTDTTTDCTATASYTISASLAVAPTITAPSTIAVEGCSVTNATNNNETTLSYSETLTTITEAQFTTEGGTYTGSDILSITYQDATTTSTDCEITVTRTFTLTNTCNLTASGTQKISIKDTTAPQLIGTVPSGSTNLNTCASEMPEGPSIADITALFTDNCGTVNVTKATENTGNNCAWSVDYTYKITDACGNAASDIVITYSGEDKTNPTFVQTLPETSITVECNNIPDAATLTATDNCGDAAVTYEETKTDGSCDSTYTLTRVWTATDTCDNTTEFTQTVNVQDNTAPVIATLPATSTIECSQTISFTQATVTDACSSDVSLTFEDVTVNGTCDKNYTVTRTWTATDNCGNFSTATQIIQVEDTIAPVIDTTNKENLQIQCGVTPEGSLENWLTNNAGATATDACGTVTWTNDYGQNTDLDCERGAITVTFTATDSCTNTATTTATYSIMDTVDPILTLPANVTIECSDDATPTNTGTATATDDCATPAVTFTDATAAGDCANSSVITRTWTATDSCGNTATGNQTINVLDTTAPTFTVPADVTIECSDDATDLTVTGNVADITDNCATDLEATFTDATATGDCPNSSVITRTWSVTDA